ncbi:MAG: RHS repeat-associated core domain-containing protein, partial [Firmicutes bacterium]|nr:RHS repeat-associated core domain-containing protein [Bacillota bacterium]
SPAGKIGGISISGPGDSQTPAFARRQYDGRNRLIGYYAPGVEATYTYQADGLRAAKTVNGITTTHVWDGSNIAADLDAGNAVNSTYLRGVGLAASRQNGSYTYYSYNGHGDVTGLTNQSGAVSKTYQNDAFGVQQNPDSGDTNPFRFCAEYTDRESGSIYLRGRYYEPSSGRFLTEDPAMDGLNWYIYGGNDPVNKWDPSGNAAAQKNSSVAVRTAYPSSQYTVVYDNSTKTAWVYQGDNFVVKYTAGLNGKQGKDGSYISNGTMYISYTITSLSSELNNIGNTVGPIAGEYFMTDGGAAVRDAVEVGVMGIRLLRGAKAAKEVEETAEVLKGAKVAETAESTGKTVDDILRDATPGRSTKGKTTQYIKTGGFNRANSEFDSLNPSNVKSIKTSYGEGRTGILSDSRTATVRPGSSYGTPTLEIRNSSGRGIEIRYEK